MSEENIVYFLMPDGTKVSNDPRFDLAKQAEEMLASRPNRGDVGISGEEMTAQTQSERMAKLQSGQPGVGENATPENPEDFLPPVGSGLQVQREDRKEAEEQGYSPTSPAVEVENPDSNEKVLEVRKAQEKRREQAAKAMQAVEDSDEGPGDPEKPYSEWTGKQLKAEALRRNAERGEEEQIELKGVRKSSELAELLQRDDEAQASAPDNQ
jgi:hypothetical protein